MNQPTPRRRPEPPAEDVREIFMARERRLRRQASPSWMRAFSKIEEHILMAAPEPLAIPFYGIIFGAETEWLPLHDLFGLYLSETRLRPVRFADWNDRFARTETALAYLLDTGLIVPGISAPPFTLGAKWWVDCVWRKQGLSPEQIDSDMAMRVQLHIGELCDPANWRPLENESRPTVRRIHEQVPLMYRRLVRRLPAYAHLPEEPPAITCGFEKTAA